MCMPKMMCSAPKPAAISASPQAGGQKNAPAPTNMKHSPMKGTGRTENEPPVTTPVP